MKPAVTHVSLCETLWWLRLSRYHLYTSDTMPMLQNIGTLNISRYRYSFSGWYRTDIWYRCHIRTALVVIICLITPLITNQRRANPPWISINRAKPVFYEPSSHCSWSKKNLSKIKAARTGSTDHAKRELKTKASELGWMEMQLLAQNLS